MLLSLTECSHKYMILWFEINPLFKIHIFVIRGTFDYEKVNVATKDQNC